MDWNKFKEDFTDFVITLVVIILAIYFTSVGIKFYLEDNKKSKETTTPVERYEIDSITKENDKLIIEVNSLDSIKNAKVIEVKSLDNDSTLRLFYELIRK